MRARVCACGCGRELLKNGRPEFSARRFYDRGCLAKDKAARMAATRELARLRRVRSVRERAVAQTLPQRREWFVIRGVRIGVFSADAFQFFIKHPELVFKDAKPRKLKILGRKAG